MKIENKVLRTLKDDFKAPNEIAHDLRLRRKAELIKLKNAINLLYSNDVIDTIKLNGEKKIYVKKM